MRMPQKLESLLSQAHIDFTQFRLLDAFADSRNRPVVILIPTKENQVQMLNLQFRGQSFYYKSLENLLSELERSEVIKNTEKPMLRRKYAIVKERQK